LALSLGGSGAWYKGEFDIAGMGRQVHGAVAYTIFPELAVGLTTDIGKHTILRSSHGQDELLYAYQYAMTDAHIAQHRGIYYSAFALTTEVHLFPRSFSNVFFTAGVGVTFYRADDFSLVRVRPVADFPAAVSVPLGFGVEHFIGRRVAAMLVLRNHFLFRGDIDAYDPAEIAAEYNTRHQRRLAIPAGGNDSFVSATIALRWYLFENEDYDGDRLFNYEEELLGTNPYEIDTDKDGLTDYDEVRVYFTNPLKPDTDDDGLCDYLEIMKYGTDPLKPDTDGDMLTDYEEVMIYGTDPLKADTDGDLLSDYEEVIIYGTDPRNPDTDFDGLDDYSEIMIYFTDPLRPDTDDDGIYDFNEVVTYRTNPLKADTDGDGLLDYDEIAYFGTNPLNPDTDGDTVDDYTEIYVTRSNPLKYDAFFPNLPREDIEAYTAELIETRDLPGGGVSYLLAPLVAPPHVPSGPAVRSVIGVANTEHESLSYHDRVSHPVPDYTQPFRQRSVKHVPPRQTGRHRVLVHLDSLHLREGDMLSFCNIEFEFNRDEVRQEYVPLLNETVRLFEKYPGMVVEIRGHADSRGEQSYNQMLSERRARSVRNFLLATGVAAARMRAVGFGERYPIADESTEEGRARNRRVELFILAMTGSEIHTE